MNEFDIIERFFKRQPRGDVDLGVGDDCAILTVPKDKRLAVSMDTLVSGIHFLPSIAPEDLGYRALAVNLSDLAAMGAEPAWVTLSLTLPQSDESWLEKFSQGFFSLQNEFSMSLVGGDITRGPLSITCQVHGFLPKEGGLQRSGAKLGDNIYVTGTLGSASLGLTWLLAESFERLEKYPHIHQAFVRPVPQIGAGLILRDYANAAIDVSDGLLADLDHILTASGVGARIQLDKIPMDDALLDTCNSQEAIQMALTGGDDYQLCFTMRDDPALLLDLQSKLQCECFCIGTICASMGILLLDSDGQRQKVDGLGYQHF